MKKFHKIKIPLRVDGITNEYIITVPEAFVNELGWYEETEINISLDGDGLYLEEE